MAPRLAGFFIALGLALAGCRAPLEVPPLPPRAPEAPVAGDEPGVRDVGELPRLELLPNHGVAPLPVEDTQVRARVLGTTAQVEIRQRFRNPYDRTIAVAYAVELPDDAQLDGLRVELGERTITSEVLPREYEDSWSWSPPEPTRELRYEFAHVPAGAQIDVGLRYLQALELVDGEHRLAVPLGPRPPGSPVRVELEVEAGAPVERWTKRSAGIAATPSERGFRATLDDPSASEFEIGWRPQPRELQATVYLSGAGDDRYFTLLVAAPAQPEPASRELIFVVDNSRSIAEHSLANAGRFVARSVARLRPSDRFNVVTLAETALFARPQPAHPGNVALAGRFLDELEPVSGPRLRPAIAAMQASELDPEVPRFVVFVSDGQLGRVDALIEASERLVGQADAIDGRAQVFAVDIAGPVGEPLRELARAGRTTPLTGYDEVRMFAEIDGSLLGTPWLDWPGAVFEAVHPSEAPQLFAGETVVLRGRVRAHSTATPVLHLRAPDGTEAPPVEVERVVAPASDRLISTGWALAELATLVGDRVSNEAELARILAQYTAIAVEHQLVTALTSVFALDGVGAPRVLLDSPESPHEIVRVGFASVIACGLGDDLTIEFVPPFEEPPTLPLGHAVWAPESIVRITRVATSEGVDARALERSLAERKPQLESCHEIYASKAERRRLRYRLHFDDAELLAIEHLDGLLGEPGKRCLARVFTEVSWQGLPEARAVVEVDLRLRLR